jgi:hypothetical protein
MSEKNTRSQNNKMDESTSSAQLKEEIAALTKSVAQLETEISQTPEPLRKSTTRVVNLGRFRNFQNLFSNWNDDSTDIIKDFNPVARIHSREAHHTIFGEDTAAGDIKEKEDEDDIIFRMSEDGDSVLVTSKESFLTASNDSISPSERAHMKILDVLRSYFYNLRNETLVTPWDSNGTVVTALKGLVEKSDLKDHNLAFIEKHGCDGAESVDLRKVSDEEGMILEVTQYHKTLLESGHGVADCVVEAARKILNFGN